MNRFQPAATVLFLAYRQVHSVAEAALSILHQQCEPIEIILSDDASGDGSFEVLQRIAAAYQGPHRVVARRNEINQGIGRHYNTLIDMASAELLITAAGDDISEPFRVACLLQAWRDAAMRPDLIASHLTELSDQAGSGRLIKVDDLAAWSGVADWAVRRPHVIGASHAFTRRMHQHFGPYNDQLAYEDQVNTLRALALGGAITIDRPLVRYRSGGLSAAGGGRPAAQLVEWARRRNRIHLALHAQWLHDAAVCGALQTVQDAVHDDHLRELFLREILGSDAAGHRWKTALTFAGLPLGWRLKKALHMSFPRLWAATRR